MSEPTDHRASETANRLGSTLFLMALAHGVLILGVTFTSGGGDPLQPSTLRVTLVAPRGNEPPEEAEYIANQNQSGSGDRDVLRPTAVVSTFDLANLPGNPDAAGLLDMTQQLPNPATEQLVTSRSAEPRAAADPTIDAAEGARAERAVAMQNLLAEPSLAAVLDLEAALPATADDSTLRGPRAQRSVLADYLNAWRERVERIGTLNFPKQFLVGNTATRRPRLEVAIGPDGSLRDIIVQASSGDRAVDQAAVSILRLAAPFDPLPPEILAEYEMLRFAYEWDFIQADR